jgi:Beta-1,3-glucanase/Divergent InlB B-repeat domain
MKSLLFTTRNYLSCRKITLVLLLIFTTAFYTSFGADDYPLEFTLVNNSGFPDEKVYLMCLGSNSQAAPDANFGYLDFSTHALKGIGTKGSFTLDVTTMVKTMAEIKTLSGNNTYTIKVPQIVSGRLYFAFGDNFDQCPSFSASGPPNGKANTVIYDKVEFDTWDNPNINVTNVDFFSVSYFVTATDSATGEKASRGYFKSRQVIFDEFKHVAGSTTQNYGNTNIFESLIITRAEQDDIEQVRILAPKNPAYSDFDNLGNTFDAAPQKCSHFFDEYIRKHCWKPNRKFEFHSKLYNPSAPTVNNQIYYGEISADGMTLNLYTDPARTAAYTLVPALPRPLSDTFNQATGTFSFPDAAKWHQVVNTDSNDIDWGYLLGGQVAVGSGQGLYWATDPVAMAILISIARGVMHHDDGCSTWTDPSFYYQGDPVSQTSTAEYPIYYYSKIVHDYSIENLAYGLSFDDIYASDPSLYFNVPQITLTFNAVKPVPLTSLVMAVSEADSGTTYPAVGTYTDDYDVNQTINIMATPKAGYHFTGWTVAGNVSITDAQNASTDITLTGSATLPTVTAGFAANGTATVSALTMAVAPANSGTISPVSGGYSYFLDEPFQIVAVPAAGYHFTGWSKSGDVTTYKASMISNGVLNGAAGTITANFAENLTVSQLTMAVSPATSGSTVPTTDGHQYYEGEILSIEAQPITGYHFTGWTVAGKSTIGNKLHSTTVVTLAATASTITANFAVDDNLVVLTMAVSPAGSGTVNPGTGVSAVNPGEALTITATAADNYYFSGWKVTSGAIVSDPSHEHSGVKLSNDATVTAQFLPRPVYPVTIGSVVEIKASDLGVDGITDFESKPLFFVEYRDPVKLSSEKALLPVVIKIDKTAIPTSVHASWSEMVPLYDKKDYMNRRRMMKDLLIDKPIPGLNVISFYVDYKLAGNAQIVLNKSIYISPPVITNISRASEDEVIAGEVLTIYGKYFGSQFPKVYVEYYTEKADGTRLYRLKACKVMRKSLDNNSCMRFKNAQQKLNRSCMKVFSDDDIYIPPKAVGYSEVKVLYPKLKAGKQLATGYLVIKNNLGLAIHEMH